MLEKVFVSSRCPKCNDLRITPFLVVEILDLLTTNRPVNCSCNFCNEIWPITPTEREALQGDLAER